MFEAPVFEPWARLACEALLNDLLFGLVLVPAVWLVLRLGRRGDRISAAGRYRVLCVLLAGIAIFPFVAPASRMPLEPPAPGVSLPAEIGATATAEAVAVAKARDAVDVPAPALLDGDMPPAPGWVLTPARLTRGVCLLVLTAWAAVTFLLLLRLGWSARRVAWLKATATPFEDPNLRRLLGQCPRRVRLALHPDLRVPVAVGWRRPAILLPAALPARLAPHELQHVVLHELAHLHRRDDWTELYQRLASALLWFHPAVRWISRGMEIEREIACDDWVVARTCRPRAYAACLTRLVELDLARRQPALAAGIVGHRRTLVMRVSRLVATVPRGGSRRSRQAMAWLAAGLTCGSLTLALAAPRIKLPEWTAADEALEASSETAQATSETAPEAPTSATPESAPRTRPPRATGAPRGELSPRSWILVLDTAASIPSSGDRTSFLVEAAPLLAPSHEVHRAYLEAAVGIASSTDRLRAFQALIESQRLGDDTVLALLRASRHIPAQEHRAQLLAMLAPRSAADGRLRDAYLAAAADLHSSPYYERAITALLDAEHDHRSTGGERR